MLICPKSIQIFLYENLFRFTGSVKIIQIMVSFMNAGFSGVDGFAATIALVGYLVVFVALVLLYLVFSKLPSLLKIDLEKMRWPGRKKMQAGKKDDLAISGEVNAAVGMALYLYFSHMHDEESGVITIKKISKRYSPWSSKIYGLRQYPRR